MIPRVIARSISHKEIVTVDGDTALVDELTLECEDSVRNGDVTEFWGTLDGCEWRVHVKVGLR